MRVESTVLILLLLLWVGNCYSDSYQSRLNCSKVDHSWAFEQYLQYSWNRIPLRFIQKYSFLVACPIIFLLQIFMLMPIIKYKMFRYTPEDIIFGLFIVQCFANISLFSTSIYHLVHSVSHPMHSSFPPYCIVTGSLNIFTDNCEKIYLFFFLFFVIFNVNRSIKDNIWIKGKPKHIITLVSAAIIVGIFWELKWVGLSQVGLCQSTQVRGAYQIQFLVFEIGITCFFIGFSIYAYRYFKVHMPAISALVRRKVQQNLLFTRFTVGMSIIEALKITSKIVLYATCQRVTSGPNMSFFATIYNFTNIIQFIFFIIVVFLHPKVGKKVKKFIRECINSRDSQSELELQMQRIHDNEEMDLGIQERIFDIMEENNQIDFIMVTQIMTMLTGVRTTYRQFLLISDNLNTIRKLHYREEINFFVDSKWTIDYQQEALILPRLSFLQSKFTIYAPLVFRHLISKDLVSDVDSSFDLIQNKEKLYKYGENTGGGRSGEFFFFTKDKKYILKTVPKVEFDNLLEELPLFMEHFHQNPNTLISKIYGMFRIEYTEIDRVYYVLLMKNILGSKRGELKRMYDMKGSTDDRQVLNKNRSKQYSNEQCLKDTDFMNIEERLHLGKNVEEFKNQLKTDTQFLKSLNIIDYSLLVMKVKWKEEPENPYFWTPLQRLQSSIFKDVFYHISLIDISQKWDIQKKSEKLWKRFLGKKDTSAQEPSTYRARFLRFIGLIAEFNFTEESKSSSSNRESELSQKHQKKRKETELQFFHMAEKGSPQIDPKPLINEQK